MTMQIKNKKYKSEEDLLDVLATRMAQAMVAAQNQSRGAYNPMLMKEASLTLASPQRSIYGRNTIFDPCSPGDIFGMQVQTVGLMPWLGWRRNTIYQRRVDFLPWVGPNGTAGEGTVPTTAAGDPCDDPTGSWEYGICGYWLQHKSWYQRKGEALDPKTIIQTRCETSPRYRVNGVLINDDVEWQANGIMNVIQMDIRRDLIHGSHSNTGQMDGLESLIKTGYTNDDGTTCPQIDSILVNWAHDDLDGSSNGLGNFFNYLDEVVTDIEYRASAFGTISETEMVLLTTRFMATCLLDAYACYTTCGVTTLGDVTDQALRAQQRQSRLAMNGGPLYDGAGAVGYIQLKSGRRLPILVEDAMDIEKGNSTWCTDIYLLTRRVGSIDVLYGEYLDLTVYENRVRAQMPNLTARADAAGRFVFKGKEDNFCVQLQLGTSPEIYLAAPWAQARFSDVCCARVRTPMAGDPFQPQYLPGGRPLHHIG